VFGSLCFEFPVLVVKGNIVAYAPDATLIMAAYGADAT
jgi:hypothetical protein